MAVHSVDSSFVIFTVSRAIYFGAYDTAKSLFDKPNIGTKFAIAQVSLINGTGTCSFLFKQGSIFYT